MIKRFLSSLIVIALVIAIPCHASAISKEEIETASPNVSEATARYGPGDSFWFSGTVRSDTVYHSSRLLML